MENSRCRWRVSTRMASGMSPAKTRSSRVTSAQGITNLTGEERKEHTYLTFRWCPKTFRLWWSACARYLPSPAGRSRRTCGWCWGRENPAEAPGPSSSSTSSTSPVSLTTGGRSATGTSAVPPGTFPGRPPGQPGDSGPPLRWDPGDEGGGISWLQTTFPVTSNASHLDFSFDEAGDVFLVLKDGQRLKQIADQPVPVPVHLLHSSSWHTRTDRSTAARLPSSQWEGSCSLPLAITQLVCDPGTCRRMRKGVTLALESNTVSSAPTRRPAGKTKHNRTQIWVLESRQERTLGWLTAF